MSKVTLIVIATLALNTAPFAQDGPALAARTAEFDLTKLGHTVVMVTGENAVSARILEDAMCARLMKLGQDVVSRPVVERAVSRELERISVARKAATSGAPALENQLDAASVGALVGARTVFLCAMAEEAGGRQTENPEGTAKERLTEYIGGVRIVACSAQIVRAGTGELLAAVAVRCPEGADGVQLSGMLMEALRGT